MGTDEITAFLIRVKKATYAGKGAETDSSRPESHDLEYKEGELMYLDTYLGGAQFAGEEAVWISGKPYWSMNYAGQVIGEPFSGDFLKEALLQVPADKPFRGPAEYKSGDYTYKSTVKGEFSWFQGYEVIAYKGEVIYECHYHGTLIK